MESNKKLLLKIWSWFETIPVGVGVGVGGGNTVLLILAQSS